MMDETKVQVVGDRLLIRREKVSTRSGLVIPEKSEFQCFGKVVGVGAEFIEKHPGLDVLGKRALFDPNVTYGFPGDDSLLLMHAAGLWAILDEDASLPLMMPQVMVAH